SVAGVGFTKSIAQRPFTRDWGRVLQERRLHKIYRLSKEGPRGGPSGQRGHAVARTVLLPCGTPCRSDSLTGEGPDMVSAGQRGCRLHPRRVLHPEQRIRKGQDCLCKNV